MLRRDFLIHAAVISSVAVVGLPKLGSGQSAEEIDNAIVPNYTLFGYKPHGCALSPNYNHHSDPIPPHIAQLLD
jgi:hypothetical protein